MRYDSSLRLLEVRREGVLLHANAMILDGVLTGTARQDAALDLVKLWLELVVLLAGDGEVRLEEFGLLPVGARGEESIMT